MTNNTEPDAALPRPHAKLHPPLASCRGPSDQDTNALLTNAQSRRYSAKYTPLHTAGSQLRRVHYDAIGYVLVMMPCLSNLYHQPGPTHDIHHSFTFVQAASHRIMHQHFSDSTPAFLAFLTAAPQPHSLLQYPTQ
eukprot:CAMPEP_0174368280 /NCGR_PEP_ID=MMETSP0811_2-20130205/88507_1 /TAXON_ID=73025 ORGANISM="Eutreptiella gymnastica-like, Strain CCMP1594" /NCGR_SAMPLE_ID=MMETSP0811_2 /ASSEMBLY_ACC=CAM_ASM_000667 /LENGTH=135 /DNA_ID=CAMNT_0015511643 /DNA_START=14 /DNA_END=421 /DNA_ORIENTATION=+